MKKIVVVGGGSAGTMSAYTLKKLFPEKEIVLLESKDIPSVGVGESTLAEFNQWLAMVDLKDEQYKYIILKKVRVIPIIKTMN